MVSAGSESGSGGASGDGTGATNGTSEVSAEASKMAELQGTLEKQSSELTVLQRRLLEAEEALRAAQRDAQRSQELHSRLQRDLHEKSAQNQDQEERNATLKKQSSMPSVNRRLYTTSIKNWNWSCDLRNKDAQLKVSFIPFQNHFVKSILIVMCVL